LGRIISLPSFQASLPQLARKDLREAGQLISKPGASIEVEVPSVARKPPVADVGDLPIGRRFDFKHEIHATIICAVDLTPAEDHLTTLPSNTDLPRREPERDQGRIEGSVTRSGPDQAMECETTA
jgi:hypothetical protein